MRIHDLKPTPGSTRRRKRVGRGIGSGTGKTSGRGSKGQNSRSGGGVRVGFEGGQLPMAMRIPKLRGFTNPFRVEYQAINLDTLEASGLDEITPASLLAKGLVSKGALVKVLGRGELTRKVSVSAHAFSASAAQAIEGSGGTTTKLDLPFAVRPAFHGSAHTNR
jgi:large subunit ribosomal protein L15